MTCYMKQTKPANAPLLYITYHQLEIHCINAPSICLAVVIYGHSFAHSIRNWGFSIDQLLKKKLIEQSIVKLGWHDKQNYNG